MNEPVISGRREKDGTGQILPEQIHARVDVRNVDEDARQQADAIEGSDVFAQSDFVAGTTGDVLVSHGGELFAG
jgi:hypothetical protein